LFLLIIVNVTDKLHIKVVNDNDDV